MSDSVSIMNLTSIGKGLAKEKSARVGRGCGSGSGKTSGRGHKGQKSRSGVAIKGFEGGQMPLLRRVPKRGFHNNFSKNYHIITFNRIKSFVEKGFIKPNDEVNPQTLRKMGLIKGRGDKVKVIKKGVISIPLSWVVSKVSRGAREIIESVGGKISIISEESSKK